MFAKQPEVLELSDADKVELPGFTPRHPASSRHQVLLYVSLLETNKAFLMNSFRAPAAQTLLLFAQNLDTNADFSIIVCDNFVELKFVDSMTPQNLVVQIVRLRSQWNKLLDLKLKLSGSKGEGDIDELEVLAQASTIEKELSNGLLELYMGEPTYSVRRLLPADLKVSTGGQRVILC